MEDRRALSGRGKLCGEAEAVLFVFYLSAPVALPNFKAPRHPIKVFPIA